MATVDKKYLDLEGLSTYTNKVKALIDTKVAKETGTEANTLGAYKIQKAEGGGNLFDTRTPGTDLYNGFR